ncbi:MAG: tRNA (adenosine(37)-N6)-dimethylallyltransferase MiaA [Alphaproteobacteria bacterium]|nr:MAG: tRNA (adenosine(37)-N6)-dimethylallyltransferase MiaA [Alphaproteobacteria bacterium]
MKCYVIAGCTASGKSNFALELAEKVGGSIVNGDSKQVYDVLPILTSQPTNLENHHLYNYFDHRQQMNLMTWLNDLEKVLVQLVEQNKVPIIVGGTGFYLNALREGIINIPEVAYNYELDTMQTVDLYKMLMILDPHSHINPHDKYRMIRALNVIQGTGKPYSWWLTQKVKKFDLDLEFIYIKKSKEEIRVSASNRLESMFPKVIDEVRELGSVSKHVSSIIGLNEIRMFLNNQIDLAQTKELILIRTLQYAKQQRTWFRNKMVFDKAIE